MENPIKLVIALFKFKIVFGLPVSKVKTKIGSEQYSTSSNNLLYYNFYSLFLFISIKCDSASLSSWTIY